MKTLSQEESQLSSTDDVLNGGNFQGSQPSHLFYFIGLLKEKKISNYAVCIYEYFIMNFTFM